MSTNNWKKDSKLFRQKVRSGEWTQSTPNACSDYVQGNLVILPLKYAFDFTLLCIRNPKPCPVLEIMESGQNRTQHLSQEADIRTDVPKYMVYKIGIKDIQEVDFGDPPMINEREVEVYWGCGVTPQMVALESKAPFMITHKPGHMFVSDMKIEEIATS